MTLFPHNEPLLFNKTFHTIAMPKAAQGGADRRSRRRVRLWKLLPANAATTNEARVTAKGSRLLNTTAATNTYLSIEPMVSFTKNRLITHLESIVCSQNADLHHKTLSNRRKHLTERSNKTLIERGGRSRGAKWTRWAERAKSRCRDDSDELRVSRGWLEPGFIEEVPEISQSEAFDKVERCHCRE